MEKIDFPSTVRHGPLILLKPIALTKVPQRLQESDIPWQISARKHGRKCERNGASDFSFRDLMPIKQDESYLLLPRPAQWGF